jgi:hypothetical protein
MKRIAPLPAEQARYWQGELYAAGPITNQPGSTVSRVVLLFNTEKREWIVYDEIWNTPTYNAAGDLEMKLRLPETEHGFNQGHYFDENEFVKAVGEFCRRINKPDQMGSALLP